MMSFGESIKTCLFEKFFRISGRATRSEFWGGAELRRVTFPLSLTKS